MGPVGRGSRAVAVAAVLLVAACSSGEGAGAPAAGTPAGSAAARAVPAGPADLCAQIGPAVVGQAVPGGEPEAGAQDFNLFSEATCAVESPTSAASGTKRRLWVELNRYGPDASGRTPDQICRQQLDGTRTRDAATWSDPSAKELPLRLGDVTQAQTRAIRWAAEAEILLCRAADFVRVAFYADGIDKTAAAGAAQAVARRVLEVFPR